MGLFIQDPFEVLWTITLIMVDKPNAIGLSRRVGYGKVGLVADCGE